MSRYKGKYSPPSVRRYALPAASCVLILAAVLSLLIGGVAAYLSASTGAVTNKFQPDLPSDPMVTENFSGNVKTDVAVDIGDPGYSVYVRAAVVVTWKTAVGGNVLADTPQPDVDYTMTLGSEWFRGDDGFYYYRSAVADDGTAGAGLTAALIEQCKPVAGRTPDGYGLNVQIVAQTVQALGGTDADGTLPVTDAWGVEVDAEGKLIGP